MPGRSLPAEAGRSTPVAAVGNGPSAQRPLDADPAAIEPGHHQRLGVSELRHLGLCDRQTQRAQDAIAQPFVLDRRAHVGPHVADQAERQLQDVGRRRRAARPVPAAAHAQQGGLLLGAGDRKPEIFVATLPERHIRHHRCQSPLDIRLAQQFSLDGVPACGLDARRQQLHRADAIAPDRGQQIEGTRGPRMKPGAQPTSDGHAVRQQVVEIVVHHVTAVLQVRGKGQRQRQRASFFDMRPGFDVAEHRRAGAQRRPHADMQPVHPHVQFGHGATSRGWWCAAWACRAWPPGVPPVPARGRAAPAGRPARIEPSAAAPR